MPQPPTRQWQRQQLYNHCDYAAAASSLTDDIISRMFTVRPFPPGFTCTVYILLVLRERRPGEHLRPTRRNGTVYGWEGGRAELARQAGCRKALDSGHLAVGFAELWLCRLKRSKDGLLCQRCRGKEGYIYIYIYMGRWSYSAFPAGNDPQSSQYVKPEHHNSWSDRLMLQPRRTWRPAWSTVLYVVSLHLLSSSSSWHRPGWIFV